MKQEWKIYFILIGLIPVLFVITFIFTGKYVLDSVFDEACKNEIVQSIPSPDEEKIAYVFKRDCGATTDDSYHLTLLKANEELQNESGNAFISEKSFTTKWTADRNLEVQFAPYADKYKMDRRVSGVQIEYLTIVE